MAVRSFVLAAALLLPFSPALASPKLQVKTKTGTVEGKMSEKTRAFLGIPYAAPPVGELRWKPPMPAAKWKGVRKATEFGARCMQAPVFPDMVFRDSGASEDCLNLNVWAPAQARKLPVMVWIYGGGFVAGATSEPRQDGTYLAQNNVVVVSMNYRLGIFGFLTHPELMKESGKNAAGNYGLMDQQAALRWVHDNISQFGGDPANVTIFGESAGSFSVSAQMASPLAKGLFTKAIGESGAAFSQSGLRFEPVSTRSEKDAKLINSTLGGEQTLAELRAIPAKKLLDDFSKPGGGFSFGPDVDGYFLPESVPDIFAAGKQNDVPLLAGWNHDEGSFAVNGPQKPTLENLKSNAEKDFGDKSAKFLELYHADNEAEAMRAGEDFAGDRFIAYGTWRWLDAQVKTGKSPVYRYRFDLAPPSDPHHQNMGAFHSSEIEYVFGTIDSKGVTMRPEDRQLSEEMQKYWTDFARSGDPNGPGLVRWPRYSPDDGWEVMYLNEKPEAMKDAQRDRYLFLSTAWEKPQQ